MFFDKLSQKASRLLQIIKSRFYHRSEESFLEPGVKNHTINTTRDTKETEETIFEILRRTYHDIAENDPESALSLIKEEIEARPPIPIRDTLLEIEREIRKKYSNQYFGGKRVK